jgi:hypothetical protein
VRRALLKPLFHLCAEAVLLIDDGQSKIDEFQLVRREGVRADYDADLAALQTGLDGLGFSCRA